MEAKTCPDVDPLDRALSVRQLARRWGVSSRTIRALIVNGQLSAFNVGLARPKLRIAAEEVRAAQERLAVVKPATPRRRRRTSEIDPRIIAAIGGPDE